MGDNDWRHTVLWLKLAVNHQLWIIQQQQAVNTGNNN